MPITPLTNTDTFQTWFTTTNSVISAVNGMTVYNILPGDGISLTSSAGVFTIKHGSSVGTPVTFTGPVSFTNTVSFSSNPSINAVTVSVSPKLAGITIGNVVRVTDSGLTLSKADSAENAEVLGIVVGGDATSHTVATSGLVNNSTFANTISNLLGVAGGTLSLGCAYFLRADVGGGITTIEPNTYGQVSKPVLLGVTGSAGAILPYRGIMIDGISAGITAELDNKIIIQVEYGYSYNGPASDYFAPLNKGDVLVYVGASTDIDWLTLLNLSVGAIKLLGKLAGDVTIDNRPNVLVTQYPDPQFTASPAMILGIVSEILNDTGSVLTLEITTRGGAFTVKKSELDSNYYEFTNTISPYNTIKGGIFKYNTDLNKYASSSVSIPKTLFANLISHNDAEETLTFIYQGTEYSTEGGSVSPFTSPMGFISTSGVTGDIEYDNLVPNGSFTIWQRGYTPFNGVTLGDLSSSNTPVCDRWFYMSDKNGNISGLTLYIERHDFDTYQTTVPGSPRYWIDLKQNYSSVTGLNYRPRFENIQRSARLLQGQQATLSFWALAGVCGATMDLIYNRYPESEYYITVNDVSDALAARETIASGVEISSAWSKYSYTFTTTPESVLTDSADEGWYGIGFEFPSSGVTMSIAQVQLELGPTTTEIVYSLPQKELDRCSPYYLRTYDWDQSTGFTGTSQLNEEYVTLGNLQSQDIYDIKFPLEMVDTPTVTLYSPTGMANEAYNVTKKADMRYPRCEGCPIHVNLPWDTTTVRTSLSSGNITVPNTSKNGMQIKINNGATHLDTLKFHYVADADIKLEV